MIIFIDYHFTIDIVVILELKMLKCKILIFIVGMGVISTRIKLNNMCPTNNFSKIGPICISL